MASTLSVTATPLTLTTVQAVLNDVWTVTGWAFSLDGENVPIVNVQEVSATTWVLTTEVLLPGRTYELTVFAVSVPNSASDEFTVPTTAPWVDYTQWPLPFPKKLLEATTYAFGKELQLLGGQPETVLTKDYTSGDSYLLVGSTHGAQHSGSVMVGGQKFSYTGKTQTALLGVTGDWTFLNIPKGAKVIFSPKTALPPTRTPGIPIGDTYKTIEHEITERHKLPFDGIADYATAVGVVAGYSTTYALVTKVASTSTSGTYKYIAMLSNPAAAGGGGNNVTDAMRYVINAGQRYSVVGLTTAGPNNYSRNSADDAVMAVGTAAVYMVGRDLTANVARGRVVGAEGVRWTFTDIATVEDSEPADLAIGAAVNHLLSPFTSTYMDFAWVATVVLRAIPTDEQLQSYAADNDARDVFGNDILWYTTASRLQGYGSGPIPPIVGTAPLTLYGPTEADLMAL